MIGAAALISPRFTANCDLCQRPVTVVSLAIYLFCAVDAARLTGRPGAAPALVCDSRRRFIAVVVVRRRRERTHRAHQAAVAVADVFRCRRVAWRPTLRAGDQFLGDMTYFRDHPPAARRRDCVPTAKGPGHDLRQADCGAGRRPYRVPRGAGLRQRRRPWSRPYIKAGDPRSMFNNTQEFTVPAEHVFRRRRQSVELDGQPRDPARLRAIGKTSLGRASEIFWSRRRRPGKGCGWVHRRLSVTTCLI